MLTCCLFMVAVCMVNGFGITWGSLDLIFVVFLGLPYRSVGQSEPKVPSPGNPLNLNMAPILDKKPFVRVKLMDSTPTLETGPATTATLWGCYSHKAAQGAWCSALSTIAIPGVESPKLFQPQCPDHSLGSLHSQPHQLSMRAAA